MPEEVKTEVKKEEPKKKGPLGKLKEKAEDSEEQLAIVSTFVRLGILIWSGGILTLNYVTIPGFPQGKIDPTFIASVFTGVLATFGVQTAKNKNGGTNGGGASGGISKSDMEKLIEKASATAPAQTIRIEQAPLQIGNPGPAKSDDSYKM
tara:strand:+ start:234 stop:683 length:450 start_codon:yes stop_codon:yes gene_type:complete